MYIFMALGMLVGLIMNYSIELIAILIKGVDEGIYTNVSAIIVFTFFSVLFITSKKFKAILSVWSVDFPILKAHR